MEVLNDLWPIRDFCRKRAWPRLTQCNHWIYTKHPIARRCIVKIGGRYLINVKAFEEYVRSATLEEEKNDYVRNPTHYEKSDELVERISIEEEKNDPAIPV